MDYLADRRSDRKRAGGRTTAGGKRENTMVGGSGYWITVVALEEFDQQVSGLLTLDEVAGLEAYLANHPDDGEIIPDTGGCRKLPWPAGGATGMSGARVVYFFRDLNMPVYLLAAFGPGERIVISKAEKAEIREVVEKLVWDHWNNTFGGAFG